MVPSRHHEQLSLPNPAATALVLPAPFRVETGRLVFAERVDGFGWLTEEHWQGVVYEPNTPTISMSPGEKRELTFRLDRPVFNGRLAVVRSLQAAPGSPGRYRFNYGYTTTGEAAFLFRVENGESVDHLIDLALPGTAAPQFRHVFSVKSGSEYAICVTIDDSNREQTPLRWISRRYTGSFGPMRRIATSPLPIVNLQAELDPLQRIAVRWTDSTNATGLVVLDLDLNTVQ